MLLARPASMDPIDAEFMFDLMSSTIIGESFLIQLDHPNSSTPVQSKLKVSVIVSRVSSRDAGIVCIRHTRITSKSSSRLNFVSLVSSSPAFAFIGRTSVSSFAPSYQANQLMYSHEDVLEYNKVL
jgi:hypothetical protein